MDIFNKDVSMLLKYGRLTIIQLMINNNCITI